MRPSQVRPIAFLVFFGTSLFLMAKPKGPNTLTVDCPLPVTLTEGQAYDTSVTGSPKIKVNDGGPVTISYLEVYQKGDCRNRADLVTRFFTITNSVGEQVRCNQNITLKHLGINDVYVVADTTIDYPDSLSTLSQKLLRLPKNPGSIKITYFDTRVSQNCNLPVRIRRQWSIEDICTGQVRTATTFMSVHKYFNHFKQFNQQSDAICTDEGFINLTPVGEFTPYSYRWSTGDSLSSLINKPAGSYTLTITDRFGCTASMVYNLLSMSQQADIGGKIATDNGYRVVPDSLIFGDPNQIRKFCVSQQSGIHYGFTLKTKTAGTYNYRFVKNTGAREALSTRDIVLIQRHILQLAKFQDTLQWIAADVNYNFNITAADVTEIRRLVLGVRENFTVVKPWYFLRKDWRAVAKPNKPIGDIEFKGVTVSNFPLTNVDVFVLKMGDVDLSYRDFSNPVLQDRKTSDEVRLEWRQPVFIQGERWIPVYLLAETDILGLQFNLQLPAGESMLIRNSQLPESCYMTKQNGLTVSWSEGHALQWNAQLPLFYIRQNGDRPITEGIGLDPEWYDSNLETYALKMTDRSSGETGKESGPLFFPNPSSDRIFFTHPEALTFSVYTMEGKLLIDRQRAGQEGWSVKSLRPGTYIVSCSDGEQWLGSDILVIR